MLAAEIRHRAACDGSFLLPGGETVKRNQSPLAAQAVSRGSGRPFTAVCAANSPMRHPLTGLLGQSGINYAGGGLRRKTMVVDATLWGILICTAGFIAFGCHLTSPRKVAGRPPQRL